MHASLYAHAFLYIHASLYACVPKCACVSICMRSYYILVCMQPYICMRSYMHAFLNVHACTVVGLPSKQSVPRRDSANVTLGCKIWPQNSKQPCPARLSSLTTSGGLKFGSFLHSPPYQVGQLIGQYLAMALDVHGACSVDIFQRGFLITAIRFRRILLY